MPSCTQPITIKQRGRPMHAACGRCVSCLLTHRAERTVVAAMEGLWTRQRLGAGHVWFVTLTLRDEHLTWTQPQAHNFQDWLSGLKPRADSKSASLSGPDRAIFQKRVLKRRHGLDERELERYRHGDYAPCPTLNRQDVTLFIKRVRKAGHIVRLYWAGEYGGEGGRPHYHLLFFGPTRAEIEQILRMWDLGFTDPNPCTWTGQRALDDQFRQNMRPGAAAKYAAKYLTKGSEISSAEDLARARPFVASKQEPPLGHHWGLEHLVPRYNLEYEAALRRYVQFPDQDRQGLSAYAVHRAAGFTRLDGWWYPLSRAYRARMLAETVIPEPAIAWAQDFAISIQHERFEQVQSCPDIAARVAEELRRARAEETRRHERYMANQAAREAAWLKEAA